MSTTTPTRTSYPHPPLFFFDIFLFYFLFYLIIQIQSQVISGKCTNRCPSPMSPRSWDVINYILLPLPPPPPFLRYLLSFLILQMHSKLYLGNLRTLNGPIPQQFDVASQLSVIDVNNDLHLDLFGEIYEFDDASNTTRLRRVFFLNKGNDKNSEPIFEMAYDPFGFYPLFDQHSSAFVGMSSSAQNQYFPTLIFIFFK